MRYRLRTLLIVVAIAPLVLASLSLPAFLAWENIEKQRGMRQAEEWQNKHPLDAASWETGYYDEWRKAQPDPSRYPETEPGSYREPVPPMP